MGRKHERKAGVLGADELGCCLAAKSGFRWGKRKRYCKQRVPKAKFQVVTRAGGAGPVHCIILVIHQHKPESKTKKQRQPAGL